MAAARAKGGGGNIGVAKQLTLPLWPAEVRAVPNAIIRGALFGVGRERTFFPVLTKIESVEGIEIQCKNDRLNQVDLDLWEALLHLQRLQPLGEKITFAARTVLVGLGRGESGRAHEDLHNGLARLVGSIVQIRWLKEKKVFVGSLVSSFLRDEESGGYVVRFNQDMALLYGSGYTYLDLSQRQALAQNNLAKWLHSYYSSHARPYPNLVKTVHRLCGSLASLKEFRRLLAAALNQLVEVGALLSWCIDPTADIVTVVKVATKSQQRHIARSIRGRS